jgi:hypothetical protein
MGRPSSSAGLLAGRYRVVRRVRLGCLSRDELHREGEPWVSVMGWFRDGWQRSRDWLPDACKVFPPIAWLTATPSRAPSHGCDFPRIRLAKARRPAHHPFGAQSIARSRAHGPTAASKEGAFGLSFGTTAAGPVSRAPERARFGPDSRHKSDCKRVPIAREQRSTQEAHRNETPAHHPFGAQSKPRSRRKEGRRRPSYQPSRVSKSRAICTAVRAAL